MNWLFKSNFISNNIVLWKMIYFIFITKVLIISNSNRTEKEKLNLLKTLIFMVLVNKT